MHKRLCCLALALCAIMQASAKEPGVTIYDADPAHLWNRLYAAIFLRIGPAGKTFGPESLDILLWSETGHLIAAPSRDNAMKVLDEFLAKHGETLKPPLARAVMQHDLWAAHQWAKGQEYFAGENHGDVDGVHELRMRIAAVIKRLALSRKEIDALPDNYAAAVASGKFAAAPEPGGNAAAFLPPGLFDSEGMCLSIGDAGPLASLHANGRMYRSAFLTFMRLPGGREALADYLEGVKKTKLFLPNPNAPKNLFSRISPTKDNPDAPQIPVGTMVALVRQMILIDDHGLAAPTHLTESVQLRRYREIKDDKSDFNEEHAQFFQEYVMDRRRLLANLDGGLRAVGPDESGFSFGTDADLIGRDPFELPERVDSQQALVMQSCIMCHRSAGVFSINSISFLAGARQSKVPRLHSAPPAEEREVTAKAAAKLQGDNFK